MKNIIIAVISIFILFSCKNEKPETSKPRNNLRYVIPAKEFKWIKSETDSSKSFIAVSDTVITGKQVIYVINADGITKRETKDKIFIFFNSPTYKESPAEPTVQCDNCCQEVPESCGGPSTAECLEICKDIYVACDQAGGNKYFCDNIYFGCKDQCGN